MATTSLPSSTSSSAATTFNGSSTYAADLQNAITRAVGFATLPLTQLQNSKTDLQSRQSAITDLSGKFQSLQTSLDAIDKAAGSQSNAATVSSPAVASATVTADADAANYSISVTNIGSTTNALSADSLPKVSNPDSTNFDSATSFTLTVDGVNRTIANPDGTLTGLKNAINASSAQVSATIINVGSNDAPDYRLSVQSNKLAATTIDLKAGATSLLTTLSTGSNVQYSINGQTASVQSDTRTVNLAPGLTVNLAQTGSTQIKVSRNASGISTALSAFATAYNAAFDELAKSRGASTSALAGDSIVYSAGSGLQNLRNPGTVSTSTVNSLEDLGLSFGKDGHISFDSSVLANASTATMSDAAKFLGSENGTGFLKAANDTLNSLDDATSGLFLKSSQSLTDQLTRLNTKIDDTQTRITALQTSLAMDNLVSRLTSALEAGDFDTHRALLPEYRASVVEAVAKAETQSFREELLAAAIRQNDQWIHLTRAIRSHIQQELLVVTGESHYYNDADERHIIHALG